MGREQEEQVKRGEDEEETNRTDEAPGTGATRDTSLQASDKGRWAAQQCSVSQAMLPALSVSQRSCEHVRAIQGYRTAALYDKQHSGGGRTSRSLVVPCERLGATNADYRIPS